MSIRKQRAGRLSARAWIFLSMLSLCACGGSGGSGGSPVPPAPPPPPTIQSIGVTLSPDDVVGGSAEGGSATADVRYNQTDSELQITVSISGLTASAVSLRNGFAGSVGAELYPLSNGTDPNAWSLITTPLTPADVDALETGALYLTVTTVAEPDGVLRGQITPAGVDVTGFDLSADQVTTDSISMAGGRVWVTSNSRAESVTVNLVTFGLDDATSAELREATAGEVGPVLFSLSQDAVETSIWQLPTTNLPVEFTDAVGSGDVYATVSTMSAPQGAIRGQLVPDNMELVITELTNAALVMGRSVSNAGVPVARAMTTIRPDGMTSNVNLFRIDDVDNVALRRAPAGQNGPALASYTQDLNDPDLWSLRDVAIDGALSAGLDNRTLYIQLATPSAPNGAARGQLETESSQQPPDTSAFVVSSIDPPNDAEVSALPGLIVATLSREPLSESVGASAVRIEASGGDGSFSDGNEVSVVPSAVTANGVGVEISLAGVVAADDVYRVSLFGDGSAGIVDRSAIPLDGDADGEPGGVFEAAFELLNSGPSALFGTIQETIFTPACATSGCHSGPGAPDGLDLSAGSAYADIVNVASVQMPNLRRIRPGNPDASYLVRKIEGIGIVANRMPLGGPPLSAQQIDLIRQWVTEGAENN